MIMQLSDLYLNFDECSTKFEIYDLVHCLYIVFGCATEIFSSK